MALEMPGFAFDQEAAEAIARQLRYNLEQALTSETAVPTVLGALALAAAAVLSRSQLKRNPVGAAMALGRLMQQALDSDRLPW